MLKWLFLVVNLTTSGTNYNPELEGSPLILILRLGDMSFWPGSWYGDLEVKWLWIPGAKVKEISEFKVTWDKASLRPRRGGTHLLLETYIRTLGEGRGSLSCLPACLRGTEPPLDPWTSIHSCCWLLMTGSHQPILLLHRNYPVTLENPD